MKSLERRSSPRRSSSLRGVCKLGPNRLVPVLVRDLTVSGCQIEIPPHLTEEGRTVMLKFGSIEAQEAKVVWTIGGQAGLQFEHPLHPAVLDHMMRVSVP